MEYLSGRKACPRRQRIEQRHEGTKSADIPDGLRRPGPSSLVPGSSLQTSAYLVCACFHLHVPYECGALHICISRRVRYSKVLRHGTNNDLTTQRERSVPMMHRSSLRRPRHSQRLQVSAMEPTAKLKLCNKKQWRNWITGGCEKGGWHRVSQIKEKRVMEGKEEYNVAWTGWGRNQKDSWVSSDDVTPKCIEAWRKTAARRIQATYRRWKQYRLERNSVIKLQATLRGHSAVRAFATRTPPLTPPPTRTHTRTPSLPPTLNPARTRSLTRTLIPTIQDFVAPSFIAAQGPALVRCIPGKNDRCVTPSSPPLLYLQNLVL